MKRELADLINNQINFEIFSAHIYLNISCYCAAEGYDGFRNWYEIQYQEEMTHAKKFINYLLDNGYTPKITNWDGNPGTNYSSLLETAQISLMHEKEVTERIKYLMSKAVEDNDYATMSFLNWYIDEQIEEEATFDKMIQQIKMVKDAGLYLLDKEYATRVFVDNTVK